MKTSVRLSQESYRVVQSALQLTLDSLAGDNTSLGRPGPCKTQECREVIRKMIAGHATERNSYSLSDLFVDLEYRNIQFAAYSERTAELCGPCLCSLHDFLRREQMNLLRMLPSYYSLPRPTSNPLVPDFKRWGAPGLDDENDGAIESLW